jgi:hypothetical protein
MRRAWAFFAPPQRPVRFSADGGETPPLQELENADAVPDVRRPSIDKAGFTTRKGLLKLTTL